MIDRQILGCEDHQTGYSILAGNEIKKIGSTLYQMMKEEVGRDLPKT
jgi:hypothetical protein